MADPQLPQARLVPQDGADRMAILRGQARDASRTAGRVAGGTAKVLAAVELCGVGVIALGTARTRTSYNVDRQLDNLRRLQDTQRLLDSMPKIDYSQLEFDARPAVTIDPSLYHPIEPPTFEWDFPKPTTSKPVTAPSRNDVPPSLTHQQRATLSP